MLNFHMSHIAQRGLERQEFVVPCWLAVAQFESRDHKEQSIRFHLRVGAAARAEHFGATHLEPDWVDGVMHESHRVAFAVANADVDGVCIAHEWVVAERPDHLPMQKRAKSSPSTSSGVR